MTREQVYARVVDMLEEMFEISPDEVTMESRLIEDLDLDSIDAIDMVVQLQDLTGKRVDEEALRQVRTVKDVVDLVETYIAPARVNVEPAVPPAGQSKRPRWRRGLGIAWAVVGGVALVLYPLGVYYGLTRYSTREVGLLLLGLLAPTIAMRLRRVDGRSLVQVLHVPLLVVALVGLGTLLDDRRYILVLPVLINLTLLITFGVTLRGGRMPMVERFARLQVADLDADELVWCRHVTVVWCIFFLLNGLAAGALALWGPLAWWAVFTGLISYVLMGLLFTVEFVLRKLRFPGRGDTVADRLFERLFVRHRGGSP